MHRWPFWMAIAVVMTVFLAVAGFGVLLQRLAVPVAQPVSVVPTPAGSIVDLRTLAGYPAAVLRLRLSDVERDEVVWDLHTDGRWAMLEKLSLEPGPNPALTPELRKWRFDVVVPEGGEDFVLTSGAEYELQVWLVVRDGDRDRRVGYKKRFVLGEPAAESGSR